MAELNRRALLALIGGGAVAATVGIVSVEAAPGGAFRLRGMVRSTASGPMPVGILKVRLEEQGIMDKAARRIAETTVRSNGRQRVVPFEMVVPRASLARAYDPGFSVRLERNGRLIAINTTKQRYRGGLEASLQIEPILY
ncbi:MULTISPECIES: YbaY family lipoprotein [Hyphomicrobiales]|jgi:uncharacterized lipoprotein YbaY|uniref:YbaY family lipoprotein n=1 Tax=Hyphomicrobiales TaxID=356 RepID=UPI000369617D|nr:MULTISPECIES: YbaY family lipoprotein [Phyllobacteriaceae]MCX8572467.1 YbaY family lipoprotein [Aminobacter sp. MET-1]